MITSTTPELLSGNPARVVRLSCDAPDACRNTFTTLQRGEETEAQQRARTLSDATRGAWVFKRNQRRAWCPSCARRYLVTA